MQWKHRVSRGWLVARQTVLTATDIKDLIPITKTGRARKVDTHDYLKVLARKRKVITSEDIESTGWAARGHIFESYAIEMYNKVMDLHNPIVHHWDDKIIANNWLGYSPDGLDITMTATPAMIHWSNVEPNLLVEVKSYSSEKHADLGHTDPMELEERWQIATAMTVSASIQKAHLVLFNPSYSEPMYVHEYTPSDLEKEIEIIEGIRGPWNKFVSEYYDSEIFEAKHVFTKSDIDISEEDIYKDWQEVERLNP